MHRDEFPKSRTGQISDGTDDPDAFFPNFRDLAGSLRNGIAGAAIRRHCASEIFQQQHIVG
ncbi:hypothetical protein A8M32_06275 [Sinorhizobium alkalisoli]|uniref:Uncharacterized protein n=1 Tax=Sinorhizobium alkalisoli TaxID=1752398 RepID=A0A1E3VF74_9HYPH|nr:hypothetical protein A8M32_06275 [Sinorhizobium alkalisoli]